MRRLFLLLFLVAFSLKLYANQTEYAPITPDNVMNLQEVDRLGDGQINKVMAWSPDGNHAVVGASRGIYLYEDLSVEGEFIELGFSVRNLLYGSDTLVFLQNSEALLAYDLVTRTILYELNGMRPLAISNDRTMLAYEMDMGVAVVEIATGEMLYELDYTGILDSEDTLIDEEYEIYNENEFIFAQFYHDDSGIVVRWNNHIMFGGSNAGTGFWDFASLSYSTLDELDIDTAFPDWGFAAFDANGEPFVVVAETIYREHQEFELELQQRSWIGHDDGGGSFAAVHGNLLALSLLRGDERGGIHSSKLLVDVRSGEIIHHFHANGQVAFSPDGSKIAIGTAMYSLETGEALGFLEVERYEVLPNAVDRILYTSHDNKRYLLDALSLQVIAEMPEVGWYYSTQLQNKLFFRDYMGYVAQVYDSQTGELLSDFRGEWQDFSDVFFSPDSNYMVSSRLTHKIFNLNTGESILLPDGIAPTVPYFHPNGTLIALRYEPERELLLYNYVTGQVEVAFPFDEAFETGFHRFSPDGRFLLFGDTGNMNIRDVEPQSILTNIAPATYHFAFSPDSHYLAYMGEGGEITTLDLLENQEISRIDVDDIYVYFFFVDNEHLYVSLEGTDFADRTFNVTTGTLGIAPITVSQATASLKALSLFSSSRLALFVSKTPKAMFCIALNSRKRHAASV